MIKVEYGGKQYKVRWMHAVGEATLCEVFEDEQEYNTEVAIRNPKDTWDRKVGRRLAITRAISGLPKEVRTAIWKQYEQLFQGKW